MKIIDCDFSYASQILDIFNDAIYNTTALYDYLPWTMETMNSWFGTKKQHNFPIIGVIDENGELLGFGSYGKFRIRPAYKYTVENSVYVHRNHRGKGIGKIILSEIILRATQQNMHCIVGVIDANNETSIRLHRNFGFSEVGIMKEVGFKFGNWLDAAFYQLTLATPEHPSDDGE